MLNHPCTGHSPRDIRSVSPICEPRRFDPSSGWQSPIIPRCGAQSSDAAYRAPCYFHHVRTSSTPILPHQISSGENPSFFHFCNSFRYRLPDLLKHEYVTLRILSQTSYEQAAQILVSPAPHVIARVFMFMPFRGVAADDLGLCEPAATRVTTEDGATFWAQVVGVDRSLTLRVRPIVAYSACWCGGGMEVK